MDSKGGGNVSSKINSTNDNIYQYNDDDNDADKDIAKRNKNLKFKRQSKKSRIQISKGGFIQKPRFIKVKMNGIFFWNKKINLDESKFIIISATSKLQPSSLSFLPIPTLNFLKLESMKSYIVNN